MMWGFFVAQHRGSSGKPTRNKDDQTQKIDSSLNKAKNKDDIK